MRVHDSADEVMLIRALPLHCGVLAGEIASDQGATMKELPKLTQRVARILTGVGACMCLHTAQTTMADDSHPAHARAEPSKAAQAEASKSSKSSKAEAKSEKKAADTTTPPSAATPSAANEKPAAPAPQPQAAQVEPVCKLGDAEQPRGGRLDVLGDRFGSAPVVRIAGKPARILIRKQDRISVQVPADSNGGEITLLNDGKVASCGTLVIIGKNR
jgi:hypothetical protein